MPTCKVKGVWKATLRRNGEVQWTREGKNIITTAGLNLIAKRMAGDTPVAPGWVAYGAGATAPALAQTALQGTEHERVALTPTTLANEVIYTATLGAGLGGTVSVVEFGLFNASSGGTMLNRFITTAFNMGIGDTLDFEWRLAFS